MTADELREALEVELAWRQEELAFFKNQLNEIPEDTRLHRFYRRVDFMEKMEGFKEQDLNIDDQIIDTESDLRYIILQKNLYKIGLPLDLFEEYQSVVFDLE